MKGKDQPLGLARRSPKKHHASENASCLRTISWENVGFDEFQLLKNIGWKCFENCLTFSKWQSFNVFRSKCCFILIASINWRLKKMLEPKWNSWKWIETKCSLPLFLPHRSYFWGNCEIFLLFCFSELGYLKPHKLLWEGIPSGSLSTFSNAVAIIKVIFVLFCDGATSIFQTSQRESLQLCRGTGVQPVPAALVCPALSVGFLASLVSPHLKGRSVSSVLWFVLWLSDKHTVFAKLTRWESMKWSL